MTAIGTKTTLASFVTPAAQSARCCGTTPPSASSTWAHSHSAAGKSSWQWRLRSHRTRPCSSLPSEESGAK